MSERTRIPIEKVEVEFRRQAGVAVQLIRLIPNHSDQLKALFWLKKLLSIRAEIPSVKRGRSDFMEYFLNVLRDAVYTAALQSSRGMHLTPRARLKLKEELRHLGESCFKTYIIDEVLKKRGPEYMCRWSEDKRTYVAMKPIPGRGALVYMAATDDGQHGWTMPYYSPPDIVTSYLSEES